MLTAIDEKFRFRGSNLILLLRGPTGRPVEEIEGAGGKHFVRYSKEGRYLMSGRRGHALFSTELALHVLTFFGLPLAIPVPILLSLPGLSCAGVAQLVEHLICNQRVGGSIPSASSTD